jgi:hypothetical protein
MLTSLLSLLGFIPSVLNTVDGITKAISDEKIAALTATTQQEQIASQERIAALVARRDVLVAEAPTPTGIWNARVRTFLAAGPVFIIFKITFWDKGIGPFFGCVGHTEPGTCQFFTTDALDPHVWYSCVAVIGFYLVASAYASK